MAVGEEVAEEAGDYSASRANPLAPAHSHRRLARRPSADFLMADSSSHYSRSAEEEAVGESADHSLSPAHHSSASSRDDHFPIDHPSVDRSWVDQPSADCPAAAQVVAEVELVARPLSSAGYSEAVLPKAAFCHAYPHRPDLCHSAAARESAGCPCPSLYPGFADSHYPPAAPDSPAAAVPQAAVSNYFPRASPIPYPSSDTHPPADSHKHRLIRARLSAPADSPAVFVPQDCLADCQTELPPACPASHSERPAANPSAAGKRSHHNCLASHCCSR